MLGIAALKALEALVAEPLSIGQAGGYVSRVQAGGRFSRNALRPSCPSAEVRC